MTAYFGLARTRTNDPNRFLYEYHHPPGLPPVIEFPLHTGEISAEARGKSINIQDQVPPLGLSSSISPGPAHLSTDFAPPCLLSHLPFSYFTLFLQIYHILVFLIVCSAPFFLATVSPPHLFSSSSTLISLIFLPDSLNSFPVLVIWALKVSRDNKLF
jgi:hypothetical protein